LNFSHFNFWDNLKLCYCCSFFNPSRLPNRNYRCDFIARSPSRGELWHRRRCECYHKI